MFLFLLIQQIVCDLPIFSSSFVNPATQWNTNPNVEYVDCPQLNNQKCATISKKTYADEGLTSTNISIDDTQDLTIEFKYLTKSQYNRGLYSNLVTGLTNPLKSGYCFGATGLPSTDPLLNLITQRTQSGYLCPKFAPVVIQDLGDQWKTIKYTIPADQLTQKTINIVFLDHLLFEDQIYNNIPGAYYITDVVVSYAGKCSNGCSECSTFYQCSSCEDGYHYLDGRCYQVNCANSLTNNVPYNKVKLTETQQSEYYSANIQIPNYIFERCWPAQWVTLESGTGKFTELTVTTNNDIATINIESKNILNYGCSELGGNKFKCNFYFNVHFNEQTLYSQNYTQTLDFTSSSLVPISFKGLVNPPALSIVIETDLFYCYRNLDDDNCWTNNGLTLVLNQNFKIKLVIKDQNLKKWNLEPGTLKLSGNGTLVDLKIKNYTIPEPGTIIYLTSLCIRGYDGVNIVATVKATNPLNKNRLLVERDNQFRLLNQERQLEQYGSNNVLGVAKITDLTIKSRQLVIEENPEWSGILISGILMILLII